MDNNLNHQQNIQNLNKSVDSLNADLEKSLTELLNNTDLLFENILKIIETSINDEEVKSSSVELLNKLYFEFQTQINSKKTGYINLKENEEE